MWVLDINFPELDLSGREGRGCPWEGRPGPGLTVRMPGMLGVWGSPGHRVWGTAVGQADQDDGGHGVGCLELPC